MKLKILVQFIDRYQEDTPGFSVQEVVDLSGEGELTPALAAQALSQHASAHEEEEWSEEVITDWDDQDRDPKCICLWGEESDIIITIVGHDLEIR